MDDDKGAVCCYFFNSDVEIRNVTELLAACGADREKRRHPDKSQGKKGLAGRQCQSAGRRNQHQHQHQKQPPRRRRSKRKKKRKKSRDQEAPDTNKEEERKEREEEEEQPLKGHSLMTLERSCVNYVVVHLGRAFVPPPQKKDQEKKHPDCLKDGRA